MSKQFKRIALVPRDVEHDGIDTLSLSETTTAKLLNRQTSLSTELGFDVTLEQTLAYLLREVPVETPEDIADREELAAMDWNAEAAMSRGMKIEAIKIVRAASNMGLKEAKDYVEARWQHLMPPRP